MFFCNSCWTFRSSFLVTTNSCRKPSSAACCSALRMMVVWSSLRLCKFLDLAFGIFQALLQGLFFLPEPRLGFLLNGPDQGEGTARSSPGS